MNAKLQEIIFDHGIEGYGLYWYCLELVAQNVTTDNLTFELEHDARIIGRNIGMPAARVQEIMKSFITNDLFVASEGRIQCLKLAQRCDDFTAKAVRLKGIKSLKNQGVRLSPTNSEKVPLEVEEEEEEEVEKNKKTIDQQVDLEELVKNDFDYENQFEKFWLSGIRKIGKKQAKSAFLKILKSKKQKTEFTDYLVKDIAWRLENDQLGFSELHPTTYLRNERWTDERRTKTATPSNHGKPSLAERSASETAIIQAKLAAGEFDQRPMGPNDAAVQEQVGFIGGGQAGDLWAEEGGVDAEFSTLVPENGGFDR